MMGCKSCGWKLPWPVLSKVPSQDFHGGWRKTTEIPARIASLQGEILALGLACIKLEC
jgi:hypothetical protein